MRSSSLYYVILFVISSLIPGICTGNDGKSPFTLQELRVSVVDTVNHRAQIVFRARAESDGKAIIAIHLPPISGYEQQPTSLIAGNAIDTISISEGLIVQSSWQITIPDSGYLRLVEVSMEYAPPPQLNWGEYARTGIYPLYTNIINGNIVSQSTAISPELAPHVPNFSVEEKTTPARRSLTNSSTITVNISGRVTSRGSNFLFKGVPGVAVFFDWRRSQYPNTSWHPSYGGASEIARTDADGNYSFTCQVQADDNDDVWTTTQIIVSAEIANDAAYDGPIGTGICFTSTFPIPISISPAGNSSINVADASIQADPNQGNALRYLWRAREACKDLFDVEPPRITFEISPSSTANFQYYAIAGIPVWGPKIQFGSVPASEASYHEYGHYLQYVLSPATYPIQGCMNHSWSSQQDDACAFVEGWADFCCAAFHGYWYRRESPIKREDDQTYSMNPIAQFPEYAQGSIPANIQYTEGSAASFIYNVWDDIDRGIPNYAGDNDDIGSYPQGYPKRTITGLFPLPIRYRQLRLPNGNTQFIRETPYLQTYKESLLQVANGYYPLTFLYHRQSIEALYSAITNKQLVQNAATPTHITITSSDMANSRSLQWDNNTSTDLVAYSPETSGRLSFNVFRNDETDFVIYRKRIPMTQWPWNWDGRDGRLDDAYEVVGYAPGQPSSGDISWQDSEHLEDGHYSYVVVARKLSPDNVLRRSIPKAQATIRVGKDITIRKDGWSSCNPVSIIPPGGSERYIVSPEGTTGTTTSQWVLRNKPSFIQATGLNTDTLTLTNTFQPGTPAQTCGLFSIACAVTDSIGIATSLSVFPAYTPLDTLNAFVAVRQNQSVAPDGAMLRGLDFITHPGESVTSVRPLTVPPIRIGTTHLFEIIVRAFPCASTSYNNARLMVVEHPPGTVVGGSAYCGFKVYWSNGNVLTEDTTRLYGLKDLPLIGAFHSRLGTVTSSILEHDSLETILAGQETMTFTFTDSAMNNASIPVPDSVVYVDTSRNGWLRDYVLELSGSYQNLGGYLPLIHSSSSVERGAAIEGYALSQNVPNPAGTRTTIQYTLGQTGHTRLEIYSIDGELVQRPVDMVQERGPHTVTIALSHLPAGVYYYTIRSGGWGDSRMLTLIR